LENIPLIAFCHLGWDWVWQRPQQFLSRLARTHPVLFVESHFADITVGTSKLHPARGHPAVIILEMQLPAARASEAAFIDAERRRLLRQALTGPLARRFDHAILWFNDPMTVTAFARQLGERLIVYDCMDELTQFHGAPPLLIERERELTRIADVIFCGGRKMRDKRLPLNPNCHFYGTGVDCPHFGAALKKDLPIAPEIATLPGPVLGYFGVVDERMDYELLAKLADAFPQGSIAIVGPSAKVDPAHFPRRPNLHWLGGRPYAELPALTKGFSVCLMPFAINAATEYINPTKALEYMAAGKPVVAIALDEIRTNFSAVAHVVKTHDEFIACCRREVLRPSVSRIRRGLQLARQNSWEAIIGRMEGHIAQALREQENSAVGHTVPPPIPSLTSNRAYV
jgi:glycosyltransferase involved in cell wall biosynthesis